MIAFIPKELLSMIVFFKLRQQQPSKELLSLIFFSVIHQGPDGHPMILLFPGQLGCVDEAVQGRETAVEDEDDEWTDCSEGEEYSSEDMRVDGDEETAGCEGGEDDEEQVDKEFPHEVMADEFD